MLKYIFALLLFGSNGTVAAYIHLSSAEIVFWRVLLGSCLLFSLFILTKQHFHCLHYKRDCVFVVLSGFAMAINWLLLFEAYKQIGVSLGMIINYCAPLIVIAVSPFIFSARINISTLLALFAALIGAILVSGQAVVGGVNPWGLCCAVSSAFACAAMIIFNKQSQHIIGIENSVIQLCSAFLVIAVFTGCTRGFSFMQLESFSHDLLPILWLGFINTGFACYLYFSSFKYLSVVSISVLGYLEPLSAVFFSWLILAETLTLTQWIGAVLIIGGAVFSELITKTKTTAV